MSSPAKNSSLSPARAASEILARDDARTALIPFIEYTLPGYRPAGHHREIAGYLEAVERGDIDRLMIFCPPRHGKSQLASRSFPAWFLGRNPGRQMIAASYNSDLASDFGREVRNIVADPDYRNVFPGVHLAEDSRAANRWNTAQGGAYVAAGVGTAITGRGAHVALIDDPLKDREEADSELIRDRVWAWYTSTFYTRLMPGGAVILIQTRWHDDDLAGRLLAAQAAGEGDEWAVVEYPALSRSGAALWPEWYPRETLDRIKAAIGPRDWSALYQQRPQPDEGLYFRREWFRWYEQAPKHMQIYAASDYAVTDSGGDYTEHGVFGVDPEDDVYILDWWSGQTPPDVWIEEQCALIARWKPLIWAGEGGVLRRAVEPFLARRMRDLKAWCRMEWLSSIADKPTRARAFQARASMGKIYLPAGDVGQRLLDQLLRFPAGAHDDAVDVCSLFGRIIDKVRAAEIPPKTGRSRPPPGSFDAIAADPQRPRSTYRRGAGVPV